MHAAHCAQERLAGDKLVDVAIRSPEVLPGRSWFAEQLDAGIAQLFHGRGQVADGETDNRAGGEMLLARIATAEDLGMPPVRQLEDPEFCFLVHQPEAEDVLVEMRQFPGVTCSRAAPAKTRDLHACQYHLGCEREKRSLITLMASTASTTALVIGVPVGAGAAAGRLRGARSS